MTSRRTFTVPIPFILAFIMFISSCRNNTKVNELPELPTQTTRTWIGPEYWANPLQDWRLHNGRMECTGSGGLRKVFLLTRETGTHDGDFTLEVTVSKLHEEDTLSMGWVGFETGILGEFDDYRSAAVRGNGFPVGITTDGRLFIGKIDSMQSPLPEPSFLNLTLRMKAVQQDDGDYTVVLNTGDSAGYSVSRKDIPRDWLEGGIAVVCHSGPLIAFPDHRTDPGYSVWGYDPKTRRGGNVNFGFSRLKIEGDKIDAHPERAFGPVLFTQYTLSKEILKLTAQLPPVGKDDDHAVIFQIKKNNKWKSFPEVTLDTLSRTATFKIKIRNTKIDMPYRVKYRLLSSGNRLKDYYYEGVIRKEPIDKEEIVVAAFTGNNDLGFPNNDLVRNVNYHDPDFLFFSGDQIYEGVGGYGTQRAPLDKACLDYLRKWYLFGWAYGDLLRNRPSAAIPDDHDVYHGNIWGAGGIATPQGLRGAAAQDMGGYKMPAPWVNMVQRTQTSHLPDPYDPTPVAQGIGVYYTEINYGGISFAVVEDRKFKSAPGRLLPEARIVNGWAQNLAFDPKTESDVKGAVLLGQRQLDFLEHWSADWSNHTWMKVVLSQTIFSNVATLPEAESHSDNVVPQLRIMKNGEYPPDDVPVADFDSDGWPQTGRNKALRIMRKAFALHIAGDQHLGSTIQYGIDNWRDAGFAFCVPSISNVWPRRWYPAVEGKNRKPDTPKYTGDFTDGFGNKITVYAVSNPVYTGIQPSKLYDRAPGYGIVRFNKNARIITIECWPRHINPETDVQYRGWPVVIRQQDNFLENATWFLPEIVIEGMRNAVIQVINEENNEIVSTLRLNENNYQPKVLSAGLYTIKAGDPDLKTEKIIRHIVAEKENNKTLNIEF